METILRSIQISIQIYGWRWDRLVDPIKIGSTGSPTLRLKTCVWLVVSQPLGALHQTQSEELVALKQQYQQLSTNYDELRQIVMELRSKMGDDTCAALFGRTVPGTTSLLLLLLQLRRYSSLILFFKHIKFVMNIWMNII